MTFTNEWKLNLFETIFEVKSSFFRLIEGSGNTLSAALMSGLLFELLTSKKCDWSTAKFDDTGWIWELESFTFNGSDLSIAEFDYWDWISQHESVSFNGNSSCTGFSFFGFYLLNGNLVCVFFNTCGWLHGRLIGFFWMCSQNFRKWQPFLSILRIQINFLNIFLPFLIQTETFSFQSRLFPSMNSNWNRMVMLKVEDLHMKIKCDCLLLTIGKF